MTVTPNLLRERLAAGGVLAGVAPPFVTPEVVEYFGLLGFDWILIDGEHGPVGIESAYSLVRAADAVGIATVVRAPANEPWLVLGYAESGADAVLVPHVVDPVGAEQLVRSIRYAPDGNRGAMSGSRAANYGVTQTAPEYFAATDGHALPMAMIEDVEALDALESIAAVPGLDAFFVGPGDLAMSMGIPGGAAHPSVVAEVHRAAMTLSGTGKVVATIAASPEAAAAAAAAGVRMPCFAVGGIIAGAMRELIAATRSLPAPGRARRPRPERIALRHGLPT